MIEAIDNDSYGNGDSEVLLDQEGKQIKCAGKRYREINTTEEEEDEWTKVKGKRTKKTDTYTDTENPTDGIDLYLSSREQLPKQFSMARILKEHSITNIINIKYLNPFKARVRFRDDFSARKLINSEDLITKGWRITYSTEILQSFGIIKGADLELKEEEIQENISCPEPFELLAVKRLDRRNRDLEGWCPSETVRLSFRGASLPAYVYYCDVRFQVEPYIYPVSQCSRCWKLGHSAKMCPSKQIVCPKCGGPHSNCETKEFRCVNCSGRHMALTKTCPAYIKQRKIREIMAEFNITYSKALSSYVSPQLSPPTKVTAPIQTTEFPSIEVQTQSVSDEPGTSSNSNNYILKPTYAAKTRNITTRKKKNRDLDRNMQWWNESLGADYTEQTEESISQPTVPSKSTEDKVSFSELLSKIKDAIFINNLSLHSKIKSVVQICIEWLVLFVVGNMPEVPMLKAVLDLFKNG